MFTIFNYLKKFESKLTEADVPEIQFLDIEHYKNENFNVNSIVGVIMSKLNDSNYLIRQLQLTTDNLKNEIVGQINSNFNNYVVLISKLQAIDFLIDNIDKPLQSIKKRILSEINYVDKYEDELKEILKYLNKNESQINMVKFSLKFYKFHHKGITIIKEIENKYEGNNLISNILNNHPDEYFLKNNNYESLRKYLIDVLRFISATQKFYFIYENYLKEEVHSHMVNEVKNEEMKYFINIEDLLKLLLIEIFTGKNDITYSLSKNLLYLIFKIYLNLKNQNLLYLKILGNGLNSDISNIFDTTYKSLTIKIDELHNLYENKYKVLKEIFDSNCENDVNISDEFFINLFILQIINKLNNDKFIYNCVDPIIFKNNYNSIINLFGKLLDLNNLNYQSIEDSFNKIKTFLHSFSFFTYFQYLQNEISKLFLDNFNNDENNNTMSLDSENNFDTYLNKYLIINSNLLFNYNKSLSDLFRERKIFLKLIPNFLNFILQCNQFLIKKQLEFFNNDNTLKLINLVKNENNFSFDEANYSTLKKNITEYMNNLNNLITYFKLENEENKFFSIEINKVIEREKIMFASSEDFNLMKSKIDLIKISIEKNLIKNLDYFLEGSFIYEISKCNEIMQGIKQKIIL